MKIIIPEDCLNEIINKDLSIIQGDQRQPHTEVSVGRLQKSGKQNTTDDFARQATQYNPTYYGGGYLREESESEITSIDVLDTMNQRGLKQVVNTLIHNFNIIPKEHNNEAIAISLKHILKSINWNDFDLNFKQELVKILG